MFKLNKLSCLYSIYIMTLSVLIMCIRYKSVQWPDIFYMLLIMLPIVIRMTITRSQRNCDVFELTIVNVILTVIIYNYQDIDIRLMFYYMLMIIAILDAILIPIYMYKFHNEDCIKKSDKAVSNVFLLCLLVLLIGIYVMRRSYNILSMSCIVLLPRLVYLITSGIVKHIKLS